MQLHLACKSRIVSLAEDNAAELLAKLLLHARAAALVPDGRVRNADGTYSLSELRLHQLGKHPSDFARLLLQASVRLPRLASVQLLIAVHAPIGVNRPHAEGERPRISVVKAHIPRPVVGNLERADNVRMEAVFVMVRVIDEFRERLSLERIPLSVQQRVPQLLRLLLQLEPVIVRDVRVVVHRRRDVLHRHALFEHLAGLLVPADDFALHLVAANVRAVHEVGLHPAVSRPAGIARTPYNRPDAEMLFRAQSRADVLVHALREVRQLVEVQPVDFSALVLPQAFALVAQVTEMNLTAVDKLHDVVARPVLSKAFRHDALHLGNQRQLQLRIRPAEQVCMRSRVLHAPHERVPADGVALAATSGPAVQDFVRRARVKLALLVRRLVPQVNPHGSCVPSS